MVRGMWPVAVQVTLRGDVSSQYLTGMLMAAPLAEGSGAIDILIQGDLVSKPYVDMTIRLMERFGVKVCPSAPVISKKERAGTRGSVKDVGTVQLPMLPSGSQYLQEKGRQISGIRQQYWRMSVGRLLLARHVAQAILPN